MKSISAVVLSLVLILMVVSSVSAYADSSPTILSLKANKKFYYVDNTVTISGFVSPTIIEPGKNLSIKVFDPYGELYLSTSLNVTKSLVATGTYFYAFDFNGKPAVPGNYEVMVTYGIHDVETVITYLKSNDDPNTYYTHILGIENKTYPIRYEISPGAEVEPMSLVPQANLLQVGVHSDLNNGTISLEIPRAILDAKKNGTDINFTTSTVTGVAVLYKNKTNFTETHSSYATRTLQFDLQNGSQEIWIYGTKSWEGLGSSGDPPVNPKEVLLLPLQQFRDGVEAKNVQCMEGYTLVIKSGDNSPACINPNDISELVKRGWTSG